ncbi:RES family NAD+ phosphorylase [Endothiovibrio diazotrophicus]
MTTLRHTADAFTGEGARRYGGRWNRKGTPLVYTAAHRSLALLEMIVQDTHLRARYTLIPATIPADLRIDHLPAEELPPHWRTPGVRDDLQALGTTWAKKGTAAVLTVPSAVLPAEHNYLLNPQHPDFTRIEIGEAEELVTDLRLARPGSNLRRQTERQSGNDCMDAESEAPL